MGLKEYQRHIEEHNLKLMHILPHHTDILSSFLIKAIMLSNFSFLIIFRGKILIHLQTYV